MLDTTKRKIGVKLVSKQKNHNFKRNKILQTIEFRGFAKKIKKIGTHLLTLLATSVILHIEQRKGNQKEGRDDPLDRKDKIINLNVVQS